MSEKTSQVRTFFPSGWPDGRLNAQGFISVMNGMFGVYEKVESGIDGLGVPSLVVNNQITMDWPISGTEMTLTLKTEGGLKTLGVSPHRGRGFSTSARSSDLEQALAGSVWGVNDENCVDIATRLIKSAKSSHP